MDKLVQKRGRPVENSARNMGYRLRLTAEEAEKLEQLSKRTGETKADLLRKAFYMYENYRNVQLDIVDEDDFLDIH